MLPNVDFVNTIYLKMINELSNFFQHSNSLEETKLFLNKRQTQSIQYISVID